jgi:hypothetical protein
MNSFKINWTFLVLIFIDCASLASPRTSFSFQVRREKRHTHFLDKKRHAHYQSFDEKRHSNPFLDEKRHRDPLLDEKHLSNLFFNEKSRSNPFLREKRHTPFLPGDYWKDNRPDFGSTETSLTIMENSTVKFKCPITHVADSSVSLFNNIWLLFCTYAK